ncbi:MAG: TatD family hydrolase [Syntrophales bacterium LBB04]|nr:TatD family hydrolase [Syntrophales bacterium LBB04]
MIIDSHTHLEMKDFDEDRDEVVARAREAGVAIMVTVGTTLRDCRKVLDLAAQYKEVYAAIGIHPHDVKGIDEETYGDLRELAGREKVVAYGEIGLDFFRNLSPRQDQIRRFGEQLEIAGDLQLPIILHDREAHQEIIEMLNPWRGRLRGVIHCFSGDRDMAKKCLDMGFSLSVPGTVTFEKAEELRSVVQYCPLESLLVETDAPYPAPAPHRGKRNEPAYVVKTAEKVAELKGLSYGDVAHATSENAMVLFGIKD